MAANLSPSVRTVLQLLQARQMFIGDELRVSTLRIAWEESGQMAEDFGTAIRELQQLGLVRAVHGTGGPAVQLTHKGFRCSTQQSLQAPASKPALAPPPAQAAARQLASQPLPKTQKTPAPASRPTIRPSAATRPAKPPVSAPTQPAARPAARGETRATTGESIAHNRVFRTRNPNLNDNILRHCLLGLLQHRKLRPNGQIAYDDIMAHWDEMGLTRADLLYTMDLLINDGSIRTTTRPRELVILTEAGFKRTRSAPSNLNDGMDRWQAKKRLRLTKQLGSLPAA